MEFKPLVYYMEVMAFGDVFGGFHLIGSKESDVLEAWADQSYTAATKYRVEWVRHDNLFDLSLYFYMKDGSKALACKEEGLEADRPVVRYVDIGAYKGVEVMIAFQYS